jgi:hypothetical protein
MDMRVDASEIGCCRGKQVTAFLSTEVYMKIIETPD